jgi:hypothetical protein
MTVSAEDKKFLLEYLTKTNNALIQNKNYLPVAIIVTPDMTGISLPLDLVPPDDWDVFIRQACYLNDFKRKKLKFVILSFPADGYFGRVQDFFTKDMELRYNKLKEVKKSIFVTLYATKDRTAYILQDYTIIGENLYMIEKTWPEIEADMNTQDTIITPFSANIFPKNFAGG